MKGVAVMLALITLAIPAGLDGQEFRVNGTFNGSPIFSPLPSVSANLDSHPKRIIRPQLPEEDHSVWRDVLIGGGVGLATGLLVGWNLDSNQDGPAERDSFWNFDSDHYYKITGSTIGAVVGGLAGGSVHALEP